MDAIVCIDERGGMAFNGRRQSQDRALRAHILARTEGGALWLTPYSKKQFQSDAPQLRLSDAPWEAAGRGEVCWFETTDPAPWQDAIEQLIVYRWNRVYPSDVRLGIDLSQWQLCARQEFAGHSHECITEEVYTR